MNRIGMIVRPWWWSWEMALWGLYHACAALCYCPGVRMQAMLLFCAGRPASVRRRTLLPFFSPEGAAVTSQGRQPLVRNRPPLVFSPEGAIVTK
ncbi:MAG: hypothetical protein HYS12_04110 [Planctomycetes bacterium]|nr:hypothetical protein [Planctomycetota bacterium]